MIKKNSKYGKMTSIISFSHLVNLLNRNRAIVVYIHDGSGVIKFNTNPYSDGIHVYRCFIGENPSPTITKFSDLVKLLARQEFRNKIRFYLEFCSMSSKLFHTPEYEKNVADLC